MNDEVCNEIRKVLKSFKRYKVIAFSSMLLILTAFKFLPDLIENYKDLVENINYILTGAVIIPLFFIGRAFYTEVKKFKRFKKNHEELKHVLKERKKDLGWRIFEPYFGACMSFFIAISLEIVDLANWVSVSIPVFFLFIAIIHELLSDKHEIKIIEKILNE